MLWSMTSNNLITSCLRGESKSGGRSESQDPSGNVPPVITSAKFFFLYLYNSVTQVLTVASGGCHH